MANNASNGVTSRIVCSGYHYVCFSRTLGSTLPKRSSLQAGMWRHGYEQVRWHRIRIIRRKKIGDWTFNLARYAVWQLA